MVNFGGERGKHWRQAGGGSRKRCAQGCWVGSGAPFLRRGRLGVGGWGRMMGDGHFAGVDRAGQAGRRSEGSIREESRVDYPLTSIEL